MGLVMALVLPVMETGSEMSEQESPLVPEMLACRYLRRHSR